MTLEDVAKDLCNELGPAIRNVIPWLRGLQCLLTVLVKLLPILEGMYYDEQQRTELGGGSPVNPSP